VIPERDHVDARREQRVGDLGRDPEPVGRVLAVRDDEVQPELLAQARDELLDRAAAGTPVHVCDEEDLQGVASVAAGWISNETWLPASCV
jgi:hypothetical protein